MYLARVLRRWYVVVLAVAVAIGLVAFHGVSAAKGQYSASATVNMGQPTTPSGGALIPNPPYASASVVSKVITSDASLAAAAKAAGVTVQQLKGRVTAHLLSSAATTTSGVKTSSGATIFEVDAQGPWGARKASLIANTLAARVVQSAQRVRERQDHPAERRDQGRAERHHAACRPPTRPPRRRSTGWPARAAGDPSQAAIMASLLSLVSTNTVAIGDDQTQLSSNTIQRASAVNIEAPKVTTRAGGHARYGHQPAQLAGGGGVRRAAGGRGAGAGLGRAAGPPPTGLRLMATRSCPDWPDLLERAPDLHFKHYTADELQLPADVLLALGPGRLSQIEVCADTARNVFNPAHTHPGLAAALAGSYWASLDDRMDTGGSP